MLYREISFFLGKFFFFFSFVILIPFALSLYYKFLIDPSEHPQPHSVLAFFLTWACCLLFAGSLYLFGRNSQGSLYRKESILLVVLIWTICPAISSLPFVFGNVLSDPLQAYFESVSGFTTTGASVLVGKVYDKNGKEEQIHLTIPGEIPVTYSFFGTVAPIKNDKGQVIAEGIEAVSKAILFWRSFIQWLGGMGIVLLFIVVLPNLGIGGKQLVSSEMPGPAETSLVPRLRDAGSILWKVYLFFTLLEAMILKLTNESVTWLDAFTISFSTLATGGFSVKNTSLGYFQSPTTQWVVIIFMIIGSLNFAIWFNVIKQKIYKVFEVELFVYFSIIISSCIFGTFLILDTKQQLLTGEWVNVDTISDAARFASFQIISANSTSGFATINFDIWPYSLQILMLALMYIGGMAGSTSGGIKILRNYILFKTAQFKVESIFRPKTVRSMHTAYRTISQEASLRALVFFLLLISLSVAATFLLVVDGIDPVSALTLVGCCINNVGFAFRAYGPMGSCAFLSDFGLIVTSFIMIAGRVEFFAIVTILIPSFWRRSG